MGTAKALSMMGHGLIDTESRESRARSDRTNSDGDLERNGSFLALLVPLVDLFQSCET